MLDRRSRRFAPGMTLDGGPLSFHSRLSPQALSEEEEAALAFAACGITGYALAELPYRSVFKENQRFAEQPERSAGAYRGRLGTAWGCPDQAVLSALLSGYGRSGARLCRLQIRSRPWNLS